MVKKKTDKYDEYPWFRIVFRENDYVVEMNQFEKLTPRTVARGLRQFRRERFIKVKELVRQERIKHARREERGQKSGQRPDEAGQGSAGSDSGIDEVA